jgi:hypothetical protein
VAAPGVWGSRSPRALRALSLGARRQQMAGNPGRALLTDGHTSGPWLHSRSRSPEVWPSVSTPARCFVPLVSAMRAAISLRTRLAGNPFAGSK